MKASKKTIVFLIEYDGTNYSGWQSQKNSVSIQETIEKALKEITGIELHVVGAGRTDAGVHSRGQVAHCRIDERFLIPEHKITSAVNSVLPPDIRILDAKITEQGFHATKDAIARQYSYYVHTRESVFLRNYSLWVPFEIDEKRLFESAKVFLGEHDFSAFAKKNPSTKNYVCRVEISNWERISGFQYKYTIKANRFVYGLIRSLVGLMLDVARNRRTIEEIEKALKEGKKNFQNPLSKSCGLYLEKVFYPEKINFFKNFVFKILLLI